MVVVKTVADVEFEVGARVQGTNAGTEGATGRAEKFHMSTTKWGRSD